MRETGGDTVVAKEIETLDELVQQGIEKELIRIENGKIRYTAIKKVYNFSDPEEKIRAKTYVELILKYKYPVGRIDLEVYPPRREPKLPADIVVYKDDRKSAVYVVIEVKAGSSDKDIAEARREGLGNANLLMSEYLLCRCGDEELAYNVKTHPALAILEEHRISQIAINYGLEPVYKYKRGEQVPFGLRKTGLDELRNKFQRCHGEIWEGGKRDPATAFDEMSKLMFAKIYDEIRETAVGEFYRFQVGTNETPAKVAERIISLYQKAKKGEPSVLATDIELPDNKIYAIVAILQDISLTATDLDAKGRAFEHFLGKYFRGEYGQFFTPRQIIEFMIEVVEPTETDFIIDPACGSGGFLLYSLQKVRNQIRQRYKGDDKAIARANFEFANKKIFGIEINDKIARIAMMDMVVHEDGHSNIECHDALEHYENFDPKKQIEPNKYSIILTNPPFGADVRKKEAPYFEDYELGGKVDTTKPSQKSEIMFLERCLEFLSDGGILGIVLPDSAISNIGNIPVCDYIFRTSDILAIVSLPQFTFSPFGSDAKTSLVFLRKNKEAAKRLEKKTKIIEAIVNIRKNLALSENEKKKRIVELWGTFKTSDYPVFIAHVEKIGHDATGREDKNYLPDVLSQWLAFKKEPTTYKTVYRDKDFWCSTVMFSDLINKLDVEAYHPDYFRAIEVINQSKDEVATLEDLCVPGGILNGFNPTSNLYVDSGIPILKTADITKLIKTKDIVDAETVGIADWDRVDSFISEEEYTRRPDKHLQIGDILVQSVAHTRAYIADKVALIDQIPVKYGGRAVALGKFLIIRPDPTRVNSRYLAMFLASPLGKAQLIHYVRGMTAEIYETDIKNTLVILPNRTIQDKVGDRTLKIMQEYIVHEGKLNTLKKELGDLIASVHLKP